LTSTEEHSFGGPWTIEKLKILRGYLAAYVRVLKNRNFTRLYIDAFAGTGNRKAHIVQASTFFELPELEKMTKGSARVALEIEPPFHRYIFIEKRKVRTSALEKLKADFPNRNIDVRHKDANEEIQRICRETDWRSNRAVLFLDPYGMQVEWETLRAAAATKAIDVWVLYPSGMGMNRMLTRNGNIRMEWQNTLDRFLGCKDWRKTFYREIERPDFFDGTVVELVKDANTEKFEAFFLNRLRTIFAGVAPRGVPLINSKGQVMYLLCFASANPKGSVIALKIADSVMRQAKVRDGRFL
jgi:three-Cys-motif partner protein